MKRQIRQGTFETNSSTQHALVIKSKYLKRSISDGIPEGFNVPEKVTLYGVHWEDNIKLNTFENRLVYLYSSLLDWQINKCYLIRFFVWLDKLGIKYELCELSEDDSYCDDIPEDFIEELLDVHHEEKFIAYLFADDILNDCYADDCGSWEQQCEWEQTIADFSKGSDSITLRTRC
jgi:hypothetical protein